MRWTMMRMLAVVTLLMLVGPTVPIQTMAPLVGPAQTDVLPT